MNDPKIRTRLHAHFDKHGAPWVDEVAMGKRRIDMVAMVDGVLTGIEIKSGADDLERLKGQLKAYRSRFRQLIVVIEEEHLESVVAAVPRWCGIWVAEQAGSAVYLKTRGRGCRKPQANRRGRVLELARLLRKAELCEALGVADDGGLARGELAGRLVATLSVEEVEAVVLESLRQRKLAAGKAGLASMSTLAD
jgi:hypothetical protein